MKIEIKDYKDLPSPGWYRTNEGRLYFNGTEWRDFNHVKYSHYLIKWYEQ